MAVRAPMQWTPYASGGFSSAAEAKMVRPMLSDGDYGFEKVSVSVQRGDPDSLLNWMSSLIRVRKESGEIGAGSWSIVESGSDAVFAIRHDSDDSSILVLNNLSGERQTVTLDLADREIHRATDLLGDRTYQALAGGGGITRLDRYGFRWLRIGGVY